MVREERMNLQSRIEFFSIVRKSRSTSLEYLRKSSPLLNASCTNWSSRFSCIWLSNMSHSSDTELRSKPGELVIRSLNGFSSTSESFCNSFNNSAVWQNKNYESNLKITENELDCQFFTHFIIDLNWFFYVCRWVFAHDFSFSPLSSNNIYFSFLRIKVI